MSEEKQALSSSIENLIWQVGRPPGRPSPASPASAPPASAAEPAAPRRRA
jgi:hypothetical protein